MLFFMWIIIVNFIGLEYLVDTKKNFKILAFLFKQKNTLLQIKKLAKNLNYPKYS